MATKIGGGIREEKTRESERIRREVLTAKMELAKRFEYYHRLLSEKHLKMEAHLDEVVHVAEEQMKNRQTKITQLRNTITGMPGFLKHNELNEELEETIRVFEKKIRVLEAIVDEIPSVWLEWRDERLVDAMVDLCRVCEGVSYVNRHNPVWSGVNSGRGQNEILDPSSLSIDKYSGNVYVCDHRVKSIQVFGKEGIHQKTIRLQELSFPTAINVTPRQLFVSCTLPDRIYKVDKVSETILCSVETKYKMSGLSADRNTLYTGMYNDKISHFRLDDLTPIEVTPLKSPHITQTTQLRDLQTPPSLFIVLFGNCNHPIQTFARNGNLKQVIASQNQLNDAFYLCVDMCLNIIVSDWGAHAVKIFSIEGHHLTTIGQGGEGPGKFYNPRGIDVDMENRIVVVDMKASHLLQFF